MASVHISNVRKTYGKAEVIHGVSVDIDDGEFVVLVGPSGCGKSTLLRMVAGLETISAGDISIDGRVVNDLAPKDRDIAMVFQNYALYPQMSVAQNMGFSLELAGVPKAERQNKVGEAAAILGLEPLLERKPGQLSGGQRQRVAMGRAIVRDPKVFLFDEPLSNLDAKLRVQMRAEIKALHQRLSSTILYVTHDQIEAMTLADKIVVLQGGIVEQAGSPLELYDRPNNTFVAGFIGSPSMNLLPGEVRDGGVLVAGQYPMTPADGPALPASGAVTVGFRPEHVRVGDAGLPAEVVLVEPTGAETHLAARSGDHEIVCILRERITLNPGDRINLVFDEAQAHFFDADSGDRL